MREKRSKGLSLEEREDGGWKKTSETSSLGFGPRFEQQQQGWSPHGLLGRISTES